MQSIPSRAGNAGTPASGSGIPDRVWFVRAGGVIAAIGLLALCTPLIWAAVSAGLGLLSLTGLALAGVAVMQAIPLSMQKLENHMLRLRKAEARRNPVEQLQNEVLRRADRLKTFRNALVTVGAQIESIEQMMCAQHDRDPGHVLERQQRAAQRLRQFQAMNLKRLHEAQSALEEFRLTVSRKESEWVIALAIDDANKALDPNATENLMDELLADTALRSVQDRFNAVFAELDVQMSSTDGPTRALLDAQSLDPLDALDLSHQTISRRNR